VDQTYLETLTQFSDIDDTNARRGAEHLSPWHKAASISHLFTPAEAKNLFLLTELPSASYGSDNYLQHSRFLLQQDTSGNTFLHLLWHKIGKSATIQALWNTFWAQSSGNKRCRATFSSDEAVLGISRQIGPIRASTFMTRIFTGETKTKAVMTLLHPSGDYSHQCLKSA
jgi:hypothetical protein